MVEMGFIVMGKKQIAAWWVIVRLHEGIFKLDTE
jgi:hypothetical protein